MTEYGKYLRLDADPVSTVDVPCPNCGTPASGECAHRVSTADLIAELRRAADKKRADLALQSAALFTRAADALEAATRPHNPQIKVEYVTLAGVTSKAYVDENTGVGTDKYTDELVTLEWPMPVAVGGTDDGRE